MLAPRKKTTFFKILKIFKIHSVGTDQMVYIFFSVDMKKLILSVMCHYLFDADHYWSRFTLTFFYILNFIFFLCFQSKTKSIYIEDGNKF